MTLAKKFEENLIHEKMIAPGDRVFIGCSGGPDSIALVYLLKTIQKSWDLDLGIFHFNHALRGRDSDRDEAFVKKTACDLKLPFYSQTQKINRKAKSGRLSIEEAARFARYEFFIKKSKRLKVRKVALAHTIDDQAETVLMRLFQGTGLRGLCGIRKVAMMERVSFVRPLLGFQKREILDFLKKNQIAFRLDKSNEQDSFLRNRIRLRLLPWLKKKVNPRIVEALARIPLIVSEEVEFLSEIEEDAWKKIFRYQKKNSLDFHRSLFLSLSAPLQFRILERGLKKVHPGSGVNFEAWRTIRRNLSRKSYRHSLPKDIDLILTPSSLRLYRK